LGKAACDADLAVVTSDNPRSEDPQQIIRDILAGMEQAAGTVHVEADRAEAIGWALEQAEPGDSVLIAGKGHEVEQIIGNRRLPFDDREVVRRCLARLTHLAEVKS
jgi:UDP-N-acetylmuramoyl-L-alanyl-D-glutamate--2,6-diaminopimelate ligase